MTPFNMLSTIKGFYQADFKLFNNAVFTEYAI
jgi:hypothetical protein